MICLTHFSEIGELDLDCLEVAELEKDDDDTVTEKSSCNSKKTVKAVENTEQSVTIDELLDFD